MYPRCEKLSALHPQCGSRLGGRYTCHTHYRSPSDLRLVWHALAIEHTRCEKLSSQLEVGRVAHRFCRVSVVPTTAAVRGCFTGVVPPLPWLRGSMQNFFFVLRYSRLQWWCSYSKRFLQLALRVW